MTLNILILAFVTLQRLGELWLSNRNTRTLLAQGAEEQFAGHYPLLVAVHAAWLALLWWLAPAQQANMAWLAAFALIELGRLWVMVSLGPRWTTRIITLRGRPLVRRGPYRWVDHPNYLIVAAEVAVLPLVFGLWRVALLFSLLNLLVLLFRIRQENRALAESQRG